MKNRLSGRFWAALTIFSLVGQVAWVVENMYFNVFIYKMFNASPSDISLMIAASAVSATVTTLLMGALSDKLGRRKIFIWGGYILWGASIMSFALIRTDVISKYVPMTVSAASVGVSLTIIMDCVMTFFGSTANDAAFNAWLTDASAGDKRGAAEGINAMMPLVAILVVFGSFMFFDLSLPESWVSIYLIIGGAVIVIGILGIFLIEEKCSARPGGKYFANIFYGFRPDVMRANPVLYLTLAAFAVFGISIQIFMPYLILYYTEALGMDDYVLIMAPAVILASVMTALYGKVYDKKGFKTAIAPTLLLLMAGYVLLSLFTGKLMVFIGSLLMMCGYLSGSAIFGAMIRDRIPHGKAGMFQGLRICFQVLIPGIIGPYIGSAVLSNAQQVMGDDGTYSFIPNRWIFVAALAAAALIWPLLSAVHRKTPRHYARLSMPGGDSIGDAPWQDYPRPQMVRDSYVNLNGRWDFAIVKRGSTPTAWEEILVPFPPESAASGVEKTPGKGEELVYRRRFTLPEGFNKGRVLLNFGAVDQICTVYLNGAEICRHEGGCLPFTAELTDHLAEENELILRVTDELDHLYPWGKQRKDRGGMWYTPVSGIWQTVWLESVPHEYIESIRFTPTLEGVTVSVGGGEGATIVIHRPEGDICTAVNREGTYIPIPDPHLWSPDNPYLYNATVTMGDDRVETYFALRTVTVGKDKKGIERILLNGKPVFFHGLLDQGYFPDGIFLPPCEKDFENEIVRLKEMGFNTLRKHIKIEPEIFYHLCDKLGMVVFQDMVNSGDYSFVRDTALPTVGIKRLRDHRRANKREEKRRELFISHSRDTVRALYNHPSICYWTIFNEGWGQFNADNVYEILRTWDDSRIIDSTSGWFWQNKSDVDSHHVYFKPVKLTAGGNPLVLSEFGGYAHSVKEHSFNPDNEYGYKKFSDLPALRSAVAALYEREILPLIPRGLCAAIYTQVSDVEDETNGVFTYDRRIDKLDAATMLPVAEKLYRAMDGD